MIFPEERKTVQKCLTLLNMYITTFFAVYAQLPLPNQVLDITMKQDALKIEFVTGLCNRRQRDFCFLLSMTVMLIYIVCSITQKIRSSYNLVSLMKL